MLFTTFGFVSGFAETSPSRIINGQEIIIGNLILLELSPIIYPLKVEIIDSIVMISMILVICSFKNKPIFSDTSELFDFFPVYIKVSK